MSEQNGMLETVFCEAERELAEEKFTTTVLQRTRRVRYRIAAGIIFIFALVVAAAALLSVPVFEFAVMLSAVLTNPIVDLGEGWLAFLLAPVNNCGAILVVVVKAARMLFRRVRRWSYVN